MAARLIINADDFGLTSGVNRAVGELHRAGVLTSATLMASGAAFDDAVGVAHANPRLGIGCHVVLTDGMPVAPPATIPTLLGSDRRSLRPKLMDFVRDLLFGRIDEAEIEREASAQIQKIQSAGIMVTHLDTHKHTHLFPAVTRRLLRVAEEHGIQAMRNPFEAPWSWSLGHGGINRRIQMKLLDQFRKPFMAQPQIRTGSAVTPDGSIGISATGDLTPKTLNQILQALPEGTWELVCHPGFVDAELLAVATRLRSQRKIEFNALLSGVPRRLAQPNPPQLIHYGSL